MESKLSGKFKRFHAVYGSIKMLKTAEFPKNSIKMKNFKIFYEPQTASRLRKLFRFPLHKSFFTIWKKEFLAEIYRNTETFAFQVFQECSSWVSRNGAVQMFSLIPTRKMFAGKFVKRVCKKRNF